MVHQSLISSDNVVLDESKLDALQHTQTYLPLLERIQSDIKNIVSADWDVDCYYKLGDAIEDMREQKVMLRYDEMFPENGIVMFHRIFNMYCSIIGEPMVKIDFNDSSEGSRDDKEKSILNSLTEKQKRLWRNLAKSGAFKMERNAASGTVNKILEEPGNILKLFHRQLIAVCEDKDEKKRQYVRQQQAGNLDSFAFSIDKAYEKLAEVRKIDILFEVGQEA